MIPGWRSAGAAQNSITPSLDFRAVVDTSRPTKALYIAAVAGVAFNVYNNEISANVQLRTGGQVIPVSTYAEVTITGYDVIYLY